MNAIITSSSLKKLVMWNKVREFKSFGLNKSQISRELGLHRSTVARYLSMSESQYITSNSYCRTYNYKLGPYENYIRDELSVHPYLSSSQVHDHLKEHFPGFPCLFQSKSIPVFHFKSIPFNLIMQSILISFRGYPRKEIKMLSAVFYFFSFHTPIIFLVSFIL